MGPDMANEMVCSQIMRACGRAGKWEIALALMDVMQAPLSSSIGRHVLG